MFHGNKSLLVAAALVLGGCATESVNQKLDKEMAQESSVKSRDDLHTEASQDLKVARVNTDQRIKLEKLRSSFAAQENEIRNSSLKLRAVLLKELLSAKYDQNEIDLIKNRMWDLENKRLSLIYGAIDEANKILGHFRQEDQKFIDDFFEPNITRQ